MHDCHPFKECWIYQQNCEKTCLWNLRPAPTQTRVYSHRRWLSIKNNICPKDAVMHDCYPFKECWIYQQHCEKTCLWGFRPAPTQQTGLYSHRRWLSIKTTYAPRMLQCRVVILSRKDGTCTEFLYVYILISFPTGFLKEAPQRESAALNHDNQSEGKL